MIKVLKRPALLEETPELDAEFRSARWVRHQLLDFEAEHQAVLDEAAEIAAPGMRRVGRIIAKLRGRRKRASHSTQWVPGYHPALLSTLEKRLDVLRKQRDKSDEWKKAKAWPNEPVGDLKRVRRTKSDTDETLAAKSDRRKTRRDMHRDRVYAERRCYHGTFMAQVDAVKATMKAVLKSRKNGLSAKPSRHLESEQISSQSCKPDSVVANGFRIIDRGDLWWTMQLRIGAEKGKDGRWITFRAKCGNWHPIPDDARFVKATLNRSRLGLKNKYSVSITINSNAWQSKAGGGVVAFDWGCRELHDGGVLAFTWKGSDGKGGRIILPPECRQSRDKRREILSRLDEAFNARKTGFRNRHAYRKHLLKAGVRTDEEQKWLSYETWKERQVARLNKRISNLRDDLYIKTAQELSKQYGVFVFEKLSNMRALDKEEETRHRKRENRDLTAAYAFKSMCERFGGVVDTVTARNSSRECPKCGELGEKSSDVTLCCSHCGTIRDRDEGASEVLLGRALAKYDASMRDAAE